MTQYYKIVAHMKVWKCLSLSWFHSIVPIYKSGIFLPVFEAIVNFKS
jgi:hypothetical protein